MNHRRLAIICEALPPKQQGYAREVDFRLTKTLQEVGIDPLAVYKVVFDPIRVIDLMEALKVFQPHFILLLGNQPLQAFKADPKATIGNWRGSLFTANAICCGAKCLATWTPLLTILDPAMGPVMRHDFARAAKEAQTDGLDLPTRTISISDNVSYLLIRLTTIVIEKTPVSVDIEGGVSDVSCIGFAVSPTDAFVIPFTRKDGSSVWTEHAELALWQGIELVLADPTVPKILQNYLYDAFVLAWTHGILIRGLRDDTMLKHFELYCELEKSLAFQTSLYTRQPFYKGDRVSTNDDTFYRYCGMDCCVTYECALAQDAKLTPGQRKHYDFNRSLLPALLYMELRGIRYDRVAAKALHRSLQRRAFAIHDLLNSYAGKRLPTTETDMVALIAQQLCVKKPRHRYEKTTTKTFKNGRVKTTTKTVSEPAVIATKADCLQYAKETCRDAVSKVFNLLERTGVGKLRAATRGQVSQLLGTHLRINSTGPNGAAVNFLYTTCGFPPQYQKEGNRLTDRLSSDDESLIKIWKATSDVRVRAFLRLRRLTTELQTLTADCDSDGRIRCGYNLVGTETARLTCYESPTGSGYNLQTVTKRHRHMFKADEGCLMAQCDLSGADGWTVAAYAAAQGDLNMLDDYLAGLKPAKITALIYEHGASVNNQGRDVLKTACKAVSQDGWLYFACKRVQHGSSYAMGVRTMADQILTDSYKMEGDPVTVDAATCDRIQNAFFTRYPGIKRWHDWMAGELRDKGVLTASNGFVRRFYGRKDDQQTLRAALAHLPQVYTTYATKLALWRLWSDPENRRADGSLRVEPLHTVHDSLVTQFAIAERPWAATKLRSWFNNTIVIAGQPIVIPWEGGCGDNWKETTEAL